MYNVIEEINDMRNEYESYLKIKGKIENKILDRWYIFKQVFVDFYKIVSTLSNDRDTINILDISYDDSNDSFIDKYYAFKPEYDSQFVIISFRYANDDSDDTREFIVPAKLFDYEVNSKELNDWAKEALKWQKTKKEIAIQINQSKQEDAEKELFLKLKKKYEQT